MSLHYLLENSTFLYSFKKNKNDNQIGLVILYMQFLCLDDLQKRRCRSLPVHLEGFGLFSPNKRFKGIF